MVDRVPIVMRSLVWCTVRLRVLCLGCREVLEDLEVVVRHWSNEFVLCSPDGLSVDLRKPLYRSKCRREEVDGCWNCRVIVAIILEVDRRLERKVNEAAGRERAKYLRMRYISHQTI